MRVVIYCKNRNLQYIRNQNQLFYFMTQRTFQQRILLQALAVTSKVKERLEPFIRQISKGNIQWTFLVFSELYQYISLPDTQLNYKFNSLVALKLLMDTCQFPVVLIVEVYFLPIIKKIACYQVSQPQKTRGIDYFYNNGYQKSNNSKKLGYNFVRLACQIINIFSIVKPFALFKKQEVSQPSEYTIAFEYMRSQGWKEYDQLAFYNQNPLKMRANFLEKLHRFEQYLQKYENFIRSSLQNILRKDLLPIGLDPRKIVQFYEPYACNFTLQLLKQFTLQYEAITLTNVFRLISQMVRWGNIGALYTIQMQNYFDHFIEMIQQDDQDQIQIGKSKKSFNKIIGTQQEKISLYVEILKSLEIWAACIPRSLKDEQKESKSTILFKKIAFEMSVKFPVVSNIKKIRNECFQNLDKYKRLNERWLKSELSKNQVILPRNRRTTMELRQLLNTQTAKVRKSVIFNDSTLHRQQSKDSMQEKNQRHSCIEQSHNNILQNIVNSPRSSITNIENDKKCPFTQKFYRQKKKKGQLLDQLHSSVSKFQTSHFKTATLQNQKISQKQKRRCSVADTVVHGRIKMLDTIPSDIGSFSKVSSEISQQQTLYTQEIEEGNVQPVIKSMQNKMIMKNLPLEQRVTYVSINNNSCSEQQKLTLKNQSSTKSKVSIHVEDENSSENMQFFSTISSKSSEFYIQNQSHIHAINVFPPHNEFTPPEIKRIQSYNKDQLHTSEHTRFLKNQFSKISEFQLEKLQQKVINLQEQNKNLKNELQKKENLLANLANNENDLSGLQKDQKSKKFSWTNYLFGNQEAVRDDSLKILNQLNKKASAKCDQLIKSDIFKNEIVQLQSLGGKKLIKNKDLLVRTENIEIGFVFELLQKQIGKVIFFITPQKDITQLKYKILMMDNIKCSQTSEVITSIPKKKQKKICFNFKVNPPFLLPKLMISYSIQGTKYNNNAIVPISFNKFITFQQRPSSILGQSLIRKKTKIQMINKRLFKSQQSFKDYFNCIPCLNQTKQESQLKSSAIIRNRMINLIFTIMNEDFIQIEYVTSNKSKQIVDVVQFLVMTLLAIIKK